MAISKNPFFSHLPTRQNRQDLAHALDILPSFTNPTSKPTAHSSASSPSNHPTPDPSSTILTRAIHQCSIKERFMIELAKEYHSSFLAAKEQESNSGQDSTSGSISSDSESDSDSDQSAILLATHPVQRLLYLDSFDPSSPSPLTSCFSTSASSSPAAPTPALTSPSSSLSSAPSSSSSSASPWTPNSGHASRRRFSAMSTMSSYPSPPSSSGAASCPAEEPITPFMYHLRQQLLIASTTTTNATELSTTIPTPSNTLHNNVDYSISPLQSRPEAFPACSSTPLSSSTSAPLISSLPFGPMSTSTIKGGGMASAYPILSGGESRGGDGRIGTDSDMGHHHQLPQHRHHHQQQQQPLSRHNSTPSTASTSSTATTATFSSNSTTATSINSSKHSARSRQSSTSSISSQHHAKQQQQQQQQPPTIVPTPALEFSTPAKAMSFLMEILRLNQKPACGCSLEIGCACGPDGFEDHQDRAPCYVCGEWFQVKARTTTTATTADVSGMKIGSGGSVTAAGTGTGTGTGTDEAAGVVGSRRGSTGTGTGATTGTRAGGGVALASSLKSSNNNSDNTKNSNSSNPLSVEQQSRAWHEQGSLRHHVAERRVKTWLESVYRPPVAPATSPEQDTLPQFEEGENDLVLYPAQFQYQSSLMSVVHQAFMPSVSTPGSGPSAALTPATATTAVVTTLTPTTLPRLVSEDEPLSDALLKDMVLMAQNLGMEEPTPQHQLHHLNQYQQQHQQGSRHLYQHSHHATLVKSPLSCSPCSTPGMASGTATTPAFRQRQNIFERPRVQRTWSVEDIEMEAFQQSRSRSRSAHSSPLVSHSRNTLQKQQPQQQQQPYHYPTRFQEGYTDPRYSFPTVLPARRASTFTPSNAPTATAFLSSSSSSTMRHSFSGPSTGSSLTPTATTAKTNPVMSAVMLPDKAWFADQQQKHRQFKIKSASNSPATPRSQTMMSSTVSLAEKSALNVAEANNRNNEDSISSNAETLKAKLVLLEPQQPPVEQHEPQASALPRQENKSFYYYHHNHNKSNSDMMTNKVNSNHKDDIVVMRSRQNSGFYYFPVSASTSCKQDIGNPSVDNHGAEKVDNNSDSSAAINLAMDNSVDSKSITEVLKSSKFDAGESGTPVVGSAVVVGGMTRITSGGEESEDDDDDDEYIKVRRDGKNRRNGDDEGDGEEEEDKGWRSQMQSPLPVQKPLTFSFTSERFRTAVAASTSAASMKAIRL